MADWTDIPDSVLLPGKPVRSVDHLAMRDNPIAIAEGATGAPRIVRAGLDTDARPWEQLSSGSVSNAASLDIIGLTSTHAAFLLLFRQLQPTTDRSTPVLRLSTDNGQTFLSGASDYTVTLWGRPHSQASGSIVTRGQVDDAIRWNAFGATGAHEYSNAAGRRGSGHVLIYDPTSSGDRTRVQVHHSYTGTDAATVAFVAYTAFGERQASEAHDAFRILFDAGNINTMEWTLFGLRAAA